MISELTAKSITFCELVEHPGGHDGGEFPQYHKYGIADDESVYYATDRPVCSNDTFCDSEKDSFIAVDTREQALAVLTNERDKLRKQLETLDRLVAAFQLDTEFNIVWADGEEDDEELDDEEDDFDDEEDDED